jgi:hypothetical protein
VTVEAGVNRVKRVESDYTFSSEVLVAVDLWLKAHPGEALSVPDLLPADADAYLPGAHPPPAVAADP